jgi:hypothetical protein
VWAGERLVLEKHKEMAATRDEIAAHEKWKAENDEAWRKAENDEAWRKHEEQKQKEAADMHDNMTTLEWAVAWVPRPSWLFKAVA